MSTENQNENKPYNPQKIEKEIYQIWEKSGYFAPEAHQPRAGNLKIKNFCIIMPPPNANEALHMGHALDFTIQDALIRFNRMQGKKTLWLPGADHAGFETQVVFEKKLEKEGKSRFQFDRKTLYQMIWDYVQKNKHTMEEQARSLGASCDWSREKFTLDPKIVEIVYDTFKKLYKDGLIYRGKRIINWCPKHQTGLSDLEVKYDEREDKLWYFKYPLSSGDGAITVATTRPETMLGDTAVAVNPEDNRYKNLIGQKVKLPLTDREIPIIADSAVELEFGTGAVKVTPSHDPIDFEIAERHNLEFIEIIGQDGKMTEKAPEKYRGLKVEEARAKVVADMNAQGLLEKEEPYKHTVGACYKCGRIIEPLVMAQWFVKIKPLAEKAIDAVKKGDVKFVTKKYEKIFMHWMKNIRDWNISRQIVWGIRIPAWYKKPKTWNMKIYGKDIFEAIAAGTKTIETRAGRTRVEGEKYWGDFKPGDLIEFRLADEKTDAIIASEAPIKKSVKKVSQYKTLDEMFKIYKPGQDYPGKSIAQINEWWQKRPALMERIKTYGIWAIELNENTEVKEQVYVGAEPPKGDGWTQDTDVFDTWFSSGQWPFVTLMTSGQNDLKEFYPTSVMVTAWDILFFWVARMIMMGIYRTGKVPYKFVYIHGLLRDKYGKKMSKSKGNVINPLAVVQERGADALRMSLIFGSGADSDIAISDEKVIAQQRFANKIWNASKFVLNSIGDTDYTDLHPDDTDKKFTKEDKWILKELKASIKKVTKDIEKYKFHEAAQEMYHFFWHKFCDKTIEDVKMRIANGSKDAEGGKLVLWTVLYNFLKLLHPFMPFITETIYQKLPSRPKELLMIEEWPK